MSESRGLLWFGGGAAGETPLSSVKGSGPLKMCVFFHRPPLALLSASRNSLSCSAVSTRTTLTGLAASMPFAAFLALLLKESEVMTSREEILTLSFRSDHAASLNDVHFLPAVTSQ